MIDQRAYPSGQRRLAVPIEIAAGLRAGKVEFADHEVRRLVVSHLAGLCLDVDDNPQRAPEPIFEHDEACALLFKKPCSCMSCSQ